MGSVGLMFVGPALLLNALVLLGKIDAKGAAPFNLFIGALQTVVPFYLIVTASSADEVLLDSGIFLFGFTYLYVGIATLAGQPSTGIGWYSAWVSLMALLFGVTEVVKFHDTRTALLWFQWVVLWGLFFVVLGLGKERLTALTGWFTFILAFTTTTVPGYLSLLGDWAKVPVWAVGAVVAATALALVPAARAALKATRDGRWDADLDASASLPVPESGRVPVRSA